MLFDFSKSIMLEVINGENQIYGGQYKPHASFDTLTGRLKIRAFSLDKFSEGDLKKLRRLLLDYTNNGSRHIRLTKGVFVAPKSHLQYVSCDSYRDDIGSPSLTKFLLDTLDGYDLDINEDEVYYPSIRGEMQNDFLKIAGECYPSFVTDFYSTVLSWLDMYLRKKKPNKFRVEFWMTYINTSTFRRFQETLDTLATYHRSCSCKVEVYWYYESEDIDMKEMGVQLIKEMSTLYSCRMIPVDNISNHVMNK